MACNKPACKQEDIQDDIHTGSHKVMLAFIQAYMLEYINTGI